MRGGLNRRPGGVAFLNGLLQPAASLAEEAALPPESPERGSQPQLTLAVSTLVECGQRLAQVVVLGLEPIEPRGLIRTSQLRLGRLGEGEEQIRVATTHHLRLTAELEALPRVLANRLQHAQASTAVRTRGLPQQTLIDQRGDELEDGGGLAEGVARGALR